MRTMREPRMLVCQHSFCLKCLTDYQEAGGNLCPICNRQFERDQFFRNRAMDKLLEEQDEQPQQQPRQSVRFFYCLGANGSGFVTILYNMHSWMRYAKGKAGPKNRWRVWESLRWTSEIGANLEIYKINSISVEVYFFSFCSKIWSNMSVLPYKHTYHDKQLGFHQEASSAYYYLKVNSGEKLTGQNRGGR